ncbi:hypothetical protein PA01_02790 [Azoarcus sp. PA01]|nr:hypothetical protein PA01_02790 [Azoarcus sp. PA01]
MKRRLRAYPGPVAERASTNFVRGFVATGLLAALPSAAASAMAPNAGKAILRQALQGGIALAAGGTAAGAMQRRDYRTAIVAVGGGAAAVIAVDYLLRKPVPKDSKDNEEKTLGQEKA